VLAFLTSQNPVNPLAGNSLQLEKQLDRGSTLTFLVFRRLRLGDAKLFREYLLSQVESTNPANPSPYRQHVYYDFLILYTDIPFSIAIVSPADDQRNCLIGTHNVTGRSEHDDRQ
jgi:hypothetical protein